MTEPGPPPNPAVLLAAGVAATAVGSAVAVYRGAERLPVLGDLLRRSRSDMMARGERALVPIKVLIADVAAQVVELVLDELDLNELVRRRVDLIGLANEVIDGIDLQSVIRESTDTMTNEVMSDVRSQGERADDAISGFVDRLLGRDRT
ncbi:MULTISPECIES: hypothetical protein [Mycobacteriaceae]|uniref:Uncharacterized protein n=1 Tax=Mycolicibacterium mucogenicum DSM 44124 TaxID=1226753 RepID=A0A8H2PK57_MYCMU|nr:MULTISPECIES: hypothetical protein [Mycobacteriaceae]KAB7752836.1 hypothetical protein MMUC44124_27000 [Mycolicibacterium mucogenicum DSM 44124]QPG69178.1 hypothetical protein C1S78_028015 [Mycolicibacterium mucogenicum DSM 44124]SEA73142.1 hypothetical protein SAMN04488580_104125 [Mycobacterium sp. 283mftsu]